MRRPHYQLLLRDLFVNKDSLLSLILITSSLHLLQDFRIFTSRPSTTAIPFVPLAVSSTMRASTLLTVASLFLIGSYSLPQPEGLEVTRTIEKREANV